MVKHRQLIVARFITAAFIKPLATTVVLIGELDEMQQLFSLHLPSLHPQILSEHQHLFTAPLSVLFSYFPSLMNYYYNNSISI